MKTYQDIATDIQGEKKLQIFILIFNIRTIEAEE
jgi:hypothetical protein